MEGTLAAGYALGGWLLEDAAGFLAWWRKDPGQALPRPRFAPDSFTPGKLSRMMEVLAKEHGSREAALAWLEKTTGTLPEALRLNPLSLR